MNQKTKEYQQALSYLIINSAFLENTGLFHGKMGIVLFFFHYAHITQSKHYTDFASYLLDNIYEEIHVDLPINLENGLCGIGWGIEYLVQQGFMDGDTDEILADIDSKVMEINPLYMSDLSFRHGLAGIVFYVTARLNAQRHHSKLPFNDMYLDLLRKAITHAKFSEEDEVPTDLKTSFYHVLKGDKINLSIPANLIHSHLIIENLFEDTLLGLENGITGWLWDNICKPESNLNLKKKKCIFLFDEESRSTKYGIGTYSNQIIDALQSTKWQVIRVRIFSEIKKSLVIQQNGELIYINIAKFKNQNYKSNNILKFYYKSVFFVLYPYLNNAQSSIFHLNSMQCEILATELKKYFPKIPLFLTVHYTNWSFDLLGDREKIEIIANASERQKYELIHQRFKSEKRLMQRCDHVIGIAQHSYNDIINLYRISKEKVSLIPHGLRDAYRLLSKKEKNQIRNKYGFFSDEKILLFAGRIDPIKGVEYLVEAFSLLTKKHPKLRLIIAGDGNLNSIFPKLNPNWSKVIYTGFIDKAILYELFSISDIGILPSLHEEFGYVALEMMMMKLPLIVGNTTGLAELVKDKESGILVPLKNEHNSENVQMLQSAIEMALSNPSRLLQFAEKGRSYFLQHYTLSKFRNNMLMLYK